MAFASMKRRLTALFRKISDSQTKGAQEALMREVFYDMYHDRHRIYWMNFARGIFFGLGTALGGTLVIALIIWVISLFVDFPLIGEYFEGIQQSIERDR